MNKEVSEMAYIDKDILDLREMQKKLKYASLETGIYIDKQIVEFERTNLFENKISVFLPRPFVTMPRSIMKAKYQSENRPQLIKTNLDTTVNFYFSYYDVAVEEQQISSAIQQAKDALKKVNPAFLFYEIFLEEREKTLIGWFDYKSYGLDEQLYNIMAITPIDKKMLHVGFNCPYRLMNEWKPAALQVLLSIWDITKENRKII